MRNVIHRLQSKSAYTLIELLVVIVVIGILIALAVPSFLGQEKKAQDANIKQDLTISYKALKAEAASRADTDFPATSPAVVTAVEKTEPQLADRFSDTADPASGELGVCEASPSQVVLVAKSESGASFLGTLSHDGWTIEEGGCAAATVADVTFVYLRYTESSGTELYLFADGSSTLIADGLALITSATAVNADNTQVAYATASHELHLVSVPGGVNELVTTMPGPVRSLDFMPNGDIYVLYSEGADYHGAVVTSAGTVAQTFSTGPDDNVLGASYTKLQVSPDGTKRVYPASDAEGAYVLNVSNIDGSAPQAITSSLLQESTGWRSADGEPRWSPDGSKIVFISARDDLRDESCGEDCTETWGPPNIYVVDADGSNLHAISTGRSTHPEDTTMYAPRFLSDGRILYEVIDGSGQSVWVMNADGSDRTQVTADVGWLIP